MKLNREKLNGRPVFVSHYKAANKSGKENAQQSPSSENKLVFSTGLEPNKLFISDMSTETTKETLASKFSIFGEMKDVRIVTYKNGNSKGLAYVVFQSDEDAKRALLGMDGQEVDGKKIKVAIRLACFHLSNTFRSHFGLILHFPQFLQLALLVALYYIPQF